MVAITFQLQLAQICHCYHCSHTGALLRSFWHFSALWQSWPYTVSILPLTHLLQMPILSTLHMFYGILPSNNVGNIFSHWPLIPMSTEAHSPASFLCIMPQQSFNLQAQPSIQYSRNCQHACYHMPSWLFHTYCTINRNKQCMYEVVPIKQKALKLMESRFSSHFHILTGLAALANLFADFPCLCNNRAQQRHC